MDIVTREMIERLYIRFEMIFGRKFTSLFDSHDEKILMWLEDWESGLTGISPLTIKDALEYCKLELEWPPSIAEFRKICNRSNRLPTEAEIYDEIIYRAREGSFKNSDHPLKLEIYNLIGQYDIRNYTAINLRKRVKEYYKDLSEREKFKLIAISNDRVSHGREISGSNVRGGNLQQASSYLL